MALVFKEAQSGGYPSVGISIGGGKSTRLYRVQIDTTADLLQFVDTFLGSTDLTMPLGGFNGKMRRVPPLADPQFDWMLASSITKMTPVLGNPTAGVGDTETLEVPTVADFGFYKNWDIVVEFTPRTYPVLLDTSIGTAGSGLIAGSWFPDVNTDSTADPQTFTYADETARYTTDPTFTSAAEFVTAQLGSMHFLTNGTKYGGVDVDEATFPAKLKVLQPDSICKFTCYQMPYRYFTSNRSYITGGDSQTIDPVTMRPYGRAPWFGRINQNVYNVAAYSFPPGSLQYMSYDVQMFTPPVPSVFAYGSTATSFEKLMNLTLVFRYTLRKVTDNRALAPLNRNYVPLGHNALAFPQSRKFHYCETVPKQPVPPVIPPLEGMASWASAPFELFLTDPDFVQAVG